MSAGAFEKGKYEGNDGKVWPVRVQPETKAFTSATEANDYAAGSITQGIGRLKVTKGKREFGLHPRTVSFVFTATPPTGYKAGTVYTIPVFTVAAWDAYLDGNSGTYLGVAIEIVGVFPEFKK
jgi:hypothetical protein